MIEERFAKVGVESPRLAKHEDTVWIAHKLVQSWGDTNITVRGELIDAMQCACLVAPEKSGLLIFREMTDNGIEIVVLEAFEKGARIGARLLNHLIVASKEQQKSYLTATTTNDNWPALRFYQKYGFHLHELRKGAVDEARSKLKPKIPIIGYDELPIRDEIELRLVIAGSVENLHEN